ncbi:MAG: hypothetical protein J6T82_09400 [Bacteroidaceae bacterium]|nr:hypothetical protein [Bacteroidaceae bacterium]
MKNLSALLKRFDGRGLSENQLTVKFEEIAKAAIFGGHFCVNNDYNIYIHEVEFYFHSENESESTVHDWAMYHRGSDVDYFPIGSLHPHNSGIDVTFEREGSYRASFLIRKYRIGNDIIKSPTYLREDLIGYTGCILGDGPCIEWIDEEIDSTSLSNAPRINLSAYDANGKLLFDEQGKKLYDSRPWRFFRPDKL